MGVFRQDLQCNLTDAELNIYRDELARLTTEEIQIEAQKKEGVTEFKAKLEKCIAQRRLLANKISTKKEYRPVDVEWRRIFEQNVAYLHRLDTGELIDSRPLTESERQQELDLVATTENQDGPKLPLEDDDGTDPGMSSTQEDSVEEPPNTEPFECICGVENCTA